MRHLKIYFVFFWKQLFIVNVLTLTLLVSIHLQNHLNICFLLESCIEIKIFCKGDLAKTGSKKEQIYKH